MATGERAGIVSGLPRDQDGPRDSGEDAEVVEHLVNIEKKLDAVIEGLQQIVGLLMETDEDECPDCGDKWQEITTMGSPERRFRCACGNIKAEPWDD